MANEETVFLTGFPGFIATRLLRRMAENNVRFLLLVQPALLETARRELEKIGEDAGRPASDFVIMPGDITEPNLGLSPADLDAARSQSTILFHLAAIYDLAVPREPAQRVNVEGTRNVSEFARSLAALK